MQRKDSVVWLFIAGLLVVFVAGCAAAPPSPLELTKKDSGSTQNLAVGQELRISLEANVTTGYSWTVDGSVPAQLEQVGEPKSTPSSDAIGAGGVQVWTFSGRSPGDGVLKLKYTRSFEPTAPPAGTFEVNVKVK